MLDPRTDHLSNDRIQQFNPFMTKIASHETWVPANFNSKASKTDENYETPFKDHRNDDGVQFRLVGSGDPESSGVHSPPLWNSSLASPRSRTQAIVRGQREIMDMIKKMPESCYELTLKDLVEHSKLGNSQEECLLQERDHGVGEGAGVGVGIADVEMSTRRSKKEKKNEGKKGGGMRSGEMENKGLFLKMVFPMGMRSKNKKKVLNSSLSAKISPKAEGSDRTSRNCDHKDWWRKRFSISSGSEGSTSSSSHSRRTGSTATSSSSSSSTRVRSGFFNSCLRCFQYSTKSKSAECFK